MQNVMGYYPPTTAPLSGNFALSSKLQRAQDRKKTEWDLNMEVEELKKQRNKDVNDIKLLKVELNKLDQLFKKYKELAPISGAERQPIQVPDFQQIIANKLMAMGINPNVPGNINLAMLETEDLLIEVARVKHQLQQEIFNHKHYQDMVIK